MFEHCVLVLNGKGGVLKTSLTAQLAGLAAVAGWRVLAIDLDQQGNLARDLGYTDRSDDGAGLYAAVVRSTPLSPLLDIRPELDVVPGGVHHLRLYREVSNPPGNMVPTYDEIRRVLAPIAPDYDLIVIDAPPGGEAIHLSALAAARWVLIPTQPDQASIDGLSTVFRTLNSVRDSTNPAVEVLGIVLGPIASNATRLRSDAVERLTEVVGDKVHIFDSTIRASQVVAVQCREMGLLVHEYEEAAMNATPWYKLTKEQRKSRRNFSEAAPGLAEDYRTLVDDIMQRITNGLIEHERHERS